MSIQGNTAVNQANLAIPAWSELILAYLGDRTLLFGLSAISASTGKMERPPCPIAITRITPESGMGNGNTIYVRKEKPTYALDRQDFQLVNYQQNNTDIVQIVINRNKEAGIAVSSQASELTRVRTMEAYQQLNIQALERAMEQDIYSLFPTAPRVIGNGTTSRVSNDLVNFLDLFHNLGQSEAGGSKFYDVCSPETYASYKLEDGLRRWDAVGQSGVNDFREGRISQKINGCTILPTSYGGQPDGIAINRSGATTFQAVMSDNNPIFLAVGPAGLKTYNETLQSMDDSKGAYATVKYGVALGEVNSIIYANNLSLNGRPAQVLPY